MITLQSVAIIIQTVGLLLGLIYFALQLRRRNKDLGYDTYLKTASAYIDLEKTLLQNPAAASFYVESWPEYANASTEDRAKMHVAAMLLMIFEQLFICRRRKWMPDDEWDGWEQWLEDLRDNSPSFCRVAEDVCGLYSRDFVAYLRERHVIMGKATTAA